jgi:cell division protein FtsB
LQDRTAIWAFHPSRRKREIERVEKRAENWKGANAREGEKGAHHYAQPREEEEEERQAGVRPPLERL